ncbi:hypothetical protein BDR06DRAFT_1007745 [Suillus hirtellus]|nr:hypothetical protein BDR06DRAFT_1007745 [Suillus hirtellus]
MKGTFQPHETSQPEHEMYQYLEWELNVDPVMFREFEDMVKKYLSSFLALVFGPSSWSFLLPSLCLWSSFLGPPPSWPISLALFPGPPFWCSPLWLLFLVLLPGSSSSLALLPSPPWLSSLALPGPPWPLLPGSPPWSSPFQPPSS